MIRTDKLNELPCPSLICAGRSFETSPYFCSEHGRNHLHQISKFRQHNCSFFLFNASFPPQFHIWIVSSLCLPGKRVSSAIREEANTAWGFEREHRGPWAADLRRAASTTYHFKVLPWQQQRDYRGTTTNMGAGNHSSPALTCLPDLGQVVPPHHDKSCGTAVLAEETDAPSKGMVSAAG